MGNTNISAAEAKLGQALASIPQLFRDRIIEAYLNVRKAFTDGNEDALGLRAGIYAEILLRFLQETLTHTHIPFGSNLGNFAGECRKLEQLPQTAGPESLRVIIPRALLFLYTVRNKRGIGHVGGDVDANAVDAAVCLRVTDWCTAEIVRVFYSCSLEEAQELLDAIAIRELPGVWSVGGKQRVLDHNLDYRAQALILLHAQSEGSVVLEDLCEWVEHPRLSDFKSRIIRKLHTERYVEYDEENQTVSISPKGVRFVEESILPTLNSN